MISLHKRPCFKFLLSTSSFVCITMISIRYQYRLNSLSVRVKNLGSISENGVIKVDGNGVIKFDGNGVIKFDGNGVIKFDGNGVPSFTRDGNGIGGFRSKDGNGVGGFCSRDGNGVGRYCISENVAAKFSCKGFCIDDGKRHHYVATAA